MQDETPGVDAVATVADAADRSDETHDSLKDDPNERRWKRPTDLSPLRLASIAGLAFVLSLAGLCGWLGYRAHEARQTEQFHALLVKVGRQGALNLTTIDYEHVDADVQRILDSATGEFYDDFKSRSGPFIDVVKQVQSKSVGTITEAGLESANDREGQVLVAVSVKTSNKGAPDDQPRYWRMRMTVALQGDEVKVSRVNFIP